MKYIKKFETHAGYEAYKNSQDYLTPNVSYCVDQDEVHFEKYVRDYSKEYFTIEALEDGNFTFTMDTNLTVEHVPYMSYSIDDGQTWVKTDNIDGESVSVTTPTILTGESVLWKSDAVQYSFNNTQWSSEANIFGHFSSSGNFNVSGNIMSLMYGDNFIGKITLKELVSTTSGSGSFGGLMKNSKVVNACNLILPFTALTNSCFCETFQSCTLLTTPPELSATTLASNCYKYMFMGCTSLTAAPELPATTLANGCYQSMFNGCTSLTTAPELPATTLADWCYYEMFMGCTSLTTAPELPVTTLVSNCYSNMFYKCTSLTTAPELPATTLVSYCYSNMFSGCTSLNYIKAMFTTTPSTSYTWNWVNGVSSTGTFVKNSAATWNVTGANGIPAGWTVQTASA